MFFTSLPIIRSSNNHYKFFENSRQQSTSEIEQEKMEPAKQFARTELDGVKKQFEDLTWDDLMIVGNSSQQSTILGRCPIKAATSIP